MNDRRHWLLEIDWPGFTRPMICVLLVGGVIVLLWLGHNVPDALWGILGAAVNSFFQDRSNVHTAAQITTALNTPAPGQQQGGQQ